MCEHHALSLRLSKAAVHPQSSPEELLKGVFPPANNIPSMSKVVLPGGHLFSRPESSAARNLFFEVIQKSFSRAYPNSSPTWIFVDRPWFT